MLYSEATFFKKMAFTEPLAGVVNSINRTGIELGDDVVVIGGGTMGLLHVMLAKLRSARVISKPLAERREKALSLGADAVIDPMSCDAVAEVLRLTNGQGAVHSLQKILTGAVSPTIKAYYQSTQLIDKGLVDPTVLTQQIFDYTDFDNAMACSMRPDTYKVILKFGEI